MWCPTLVCVARLTLAFAHLARICQEIPVVIGLLCLAGVMLVAERAMAQNQETTTRRHLHLGGFVGRFHQVLRHTGIAACGRAALLRGVRSTVVVSLWISLMFHALLGQAAAATHHWPVLVLKRLAAPLRSHAFLQMTTSPCEIGSTSCFLPDLPTPARLKFDSELAGEDPSRPAILELRTAHRGPLAHHWLELNGRMTIGFGPATLPFIDAGQVSLQDLYGNIKRISGMHPLPPLGLPPINHHYARAPGEGRIVGKPIRLTTAQSDALVQKLQHLKFVGPYIPIFHDCRTFACTVQARGQGHSILPCYLLLKGYW